ncbi:unnamed protein product, partial [Gordionus sp. m RMFG-2023]
DRISFQPEGVVQKLVISKVVPEDKGVYALEFEGEQVKTEVVVKEIPTEKIEEIQVIEVDQGATLEITVTLSREIKDVKWKKDETEILEDDRVKFVQQGVVYKLVVSKVDHEDKGIYSLEFEGKKVKTRVIINEIPVEKLEEVNIVEIEEGSRLDLAVTLPRKVDTVTWKKDETEILKDDRISFQPEGVVQKLVISKVVPEDKGVYALEFEGEQVKTEVVVKEIPTEKIEEIQVIEVDQGATLEITVTLSREIKDVKWKKDETEILEDDRVKFVQQGVVYKLVVSKVDHEDKGIYSLEFEGKKVKTRVIINEIPVEKLEEVNIVEIEEGSRLDLAVTLPRKVDTVTWKKDETEILKDDRISFQPEGVVQKLVISKVVPEDKGVYALEFEGEQVKTEVVVKEIPTEKIEEIQVIEVDQGATLEITVTLSREIKDVKWKKDETEILEDDRVKFVQQGVVYKLVVSKVDHEDKGIYSLEFEGKKVKTRVIINEIPVEKLEEVNIVEIEEGSRLDLAVTLPRKVDTVTWKKDETEILKDDRISFQPEGVVQKLVISKVVPEDKGVYALEFEGEQVKTEVVVKEIPTEKIEEIQVIEVDQGATLEITVTLSREIKDVKWKKDETEILEDDRVKFVQQGVVYKLVVSKVDHEDKGIYSLEFEGKKVKTRVIINEIPVEKLEEVNIVEIEEGSRLDLAVTLPRKVDTVTWKKDETEILKDDRISFQPEGVVQKLVISKVVPEDKGVYALEFEGEQVKTEVVVKEIPTEKIEEIQVIEVDQGATLEITVTLSREIKDVKWKKDETEILEDDRVKFVQQGVVYKLVVSKVDHKDKGIYSLEFEGKKVKTRVIINGTAT